jgi:hypothetical protein
MLKKYTKYAATAFAVASLSTFMIGCGESTDETPDPVPTTETPAGMPEGMNEAGEGKKQELKEGEKPPVSPTK